MARRTLIVANDLGGNAGLGFQTVVPCSISENGSVQKLVIHMPSGNEPLDRAAGAGISASNPFPPLPNEYKGSILKLQLVFSYKMATGTGLR